MPDPELARPAYCQRADHALYRHGLNQRPNSTGTAQSFTGLSVFYDPQIAAGVNGTNAIGIQAGPSTSAFRLAGGNVTLINAGTSVCVDANGGEVWLEDINLNTCATGITVENNGTQGRAVVRIREDSGVGTEGIFAANTIGSHVFCGNCSSNNVVDNGSAATSANTFYSPVSFWLNDAHWGIFGTPGNFNIKDVVNSKTPISIVPNGNMFLGNAANPVILDNGDRFLLNENSDGSCSAGNELMFASSTRHALSWCNNGGTIFAGTQTIARGTATMTTAPITAVNCGTTVTVSATGVATTDTITWAFKAAPAGSNAGLVAWPTSGNVNFAYCPNTAETPAAATINWRVVR